MQPLETREIFLKSNPNLTFAHQEQIVALGRKWKKKVIEGDREKIENFVKRIINSYDHHVTRQFFMENNIPVTGSLRQQIKTIWEEAGKKIDYYTHLPSEEKSKLEEFDKKWVINAEQRNEKENTRLLIEMLSDPQITISSISAFYERNEIFPEGRFRTNPEVIEAEKDKIEKERRNFLVALLETIEYDAVGAQGIRESLSGKRINLTEIEIRNKKDKVIPVLEAFYRDFTRANYYLNGVLFNEKTPEVNLTKLNDSFTPQQLKNLTLVLNQSSFADPLAKLSNKMVLEGLLPMDGVYTDFRIEKIKNTQLVKLTLITDLVIRDLFDPTNVKGYVGYGADIYISEDELNQDWLNKGDIAPKMRVVDYFSPMQRTPEQAIQFAQEASKIHTDSFIQSLA